MQSLMSRWAVVFWCGLMVVSFQNCSKIGHNGVAFQSESLGLASEVPVAVPGQVEIVDDGEGDGQSPSNPGGNGKENPGKDGEVASEEQAPSEEPRPEITDKEISEIVALCNDIEEASGFNESQSIRVVHDSFDSIVNKVSSFSSVHSRVVLRAAGAESKVDDSQLVHSDLVLCGFSNLGSIRSTASRIFVVGGTVQDAHLVHSSMVLINAKMNDYRGVKSVIKRYSLQ